MTAIMLQRGTGVVLQVLWDCANPTKNGLRALIEYMEGNYGL